MTWLSLDFETRSQFDLRKVGAYRYVDDPLTSIICAAYAFGDGPVALWIPGQPVPGALADHVRSGGLVRAWSAQFERLVWQSIWGPRHNFPVPRLEQFACTAALAARASLPRKLENAAKALGLAQQKDMEGQKAMKALTMPRRLTKAEKAAGHVGPTWWTPDDRPELYEACYAYCRQDVETERAILHALPAVNHPLERTIWLHDQQINDRGVHVDQELIRTGIIVADRAVNALNARLSDLVGEPTKVSNPGKIKQWVQANGLPEVTSLNKANVRELLKGGLDDTVHAVLRLRQEGGKSSLAKLRTMQAMCSADTRIHGMLLYYAANTGRWAGRGVQPQNFPRGSVEWGRGTAPTLEDAVRLVKTADFDLVDTLLPDDIPVMYLLSSLLRGCFLATDGYEFVVADFAAIEARVLAWLYTAETLLRSYRTGGSAYLDMGRVIYGRAISKKDDPTEYQVSKNTVLGCGYQMGWETYRDQLWTQTGLLLEDELCQRAVAAYRGLYWEIPGGWKDINRTCQTVVRNHLTDWTTVDSTHGKLHFAIDDASGYLMMRLPSGRNLWYPEPRMSLRKAPWGDMVACVTTACEIKPGVWGRQALYGGLLTENAVQAIARDLLAEAMLRVEAAGYPVVLTVHDEIVTEVPTGFGDVDDFCHLMAAAPAWATDCPIAAEGWRGRRYRK